jgi:hypothetical protein
VQHETIRAFPPRFSLSLVHSWVPLAGCSAWEGLHCCPGLLLACRSYGWLSPWLVPRTAASASLTANLAQNGSWETRIPFGREYCFEWRVERHQLLVIAAYGRQSCLCCQAGSWYAHAAMEQHHLEAPSTSSQASAIATAARVQQPRAVQQERCHSGSLEGKKHPPPFVELGMDVELPGCWGNLLTVLRQVLAFDCHQASRWLMALSL